MLVEPPKNHTDAKIGVCFIPLCVSSIVDHLLIRPLYMKAITVVSGFVNYAYATQYHDQLGALSDAYGLCVTTCAHIFASSTS